MITFPAFPEYDDVLTIPDGWVDVSYCNNACPSISHNFGEDHAITIYCDYKDASKRADGQGCVYRFIVIIEDGIGEEYRGCFCQFDDAVMFANALIKQEYTK
jgi:hypothetical protein